MALKGIKFDDEVLEVPSKLSELDNDTEFISATVDNLLNYYNKNEVNQLLGNISGLKYEVVTSLPIEDISTTTIYLIAKPAQTENNIYDEYIYISDKWELIGSTSVDLTDYYTKNEVDAKVSSLNNEVSTIKNDISDIDQDIINTNDKFKNYLPLTGGVLTGNVISTADVTAQQVTMGAGKLMGSVTQQEEDYVVVTDSAGNMHKRATNKVLDDIGGSTILVDSVRKSTFEMDSKQDKLTAGTNITIDENNIISASGGASIAIDSELSTTSENPVQNKIINEALNLKANDDDVIHKSFHEETIEGILTFKNAIRTQPEPIIIKLEDRVSATPITWYGTGQPLVFGDISQSLQFIGSNDRPKYKYLSTDSTPAVTKDFAFLSDIPNTDDFALKIDVGTIQTQVAENTTDIATNIGDIAALQQKINELAQYPKVEVFFDMNSEDAAINQGYTTGLPSGKAINWTNENYDLIRIYGHLAGFLGYIEVPLEGRPHDDILMTATNATGKIIHYLRGILYKDYKRFNLGGRATYTITDGLLTVDTTKDETKYYVTRAEGVILRPRW